MKLNRGGAGRFGYLNCCLVACWASCVGAQPALTNTGQSFPSKAIRFLVPFGPGGVGDITARIVAQKLSESMGQQVIVDNRPSAGGAIATEVVARAEPDGHTLLLLNNAHAVSTSLFKSLPYDVARDFAPVSTISSFSIVMLAAPETPVKSVKDVVALARSSPKGINIGTIAVGSTQNLSAELFKSMTGVSASIIPFNNTGALLSSLRGNDVQVAFEVLAPVIGQVKAGNLRAIAVSLTTRFSGLPDVPTVAESGVPGYSVQSWNGVGVPARTPRAIINRLNKEINAALNTADVRQRFQEMGVEARGNTPEAFRDFIMAETAKWKTVIENAKIPKQ